MNINSRISDSNNILQTVLSQINKLPTPAFQSAALITPGASTKVAVYSGYYTTGDVRIAGDSKLISENIKKGVSIFGVSGTLIGGSDAKDLLEYPTNFENGTASYLRYYCFLSCSTLTSVSFPAATYIGSGAFMSCYNLKEAYLPQVDMLDQRVFYGCSSLSKVQLGKINAIPSYAFMSCFSLTDIALPSQINRIYSYGFAYCGFSQMPTIAKTIESGAFLRCSNLQAISCEHNELIGVSAFHYCISLKQANLASTATVSQNAFLDCSALSLVSAPKLEYIGISAFHRCYSLSKIYLMGSSVCVLANSNAFSSTPIAGYSGNGSIYVPQSLVNTYKNNTNWTYFSSRIFAAN